MLTLLRHHVVVALHLLQSVEGERRPDGLRTRGVGVGRIGLVSRVVVAQRRPEVEEVLGVVLIEVEIIHRSRETVA